MRPVKPAPILFVDDSAVARAALKHRLTERGLEVVVLASATEAAAVQGSSFAAALLDIELGDGFGPEIAAHLRKSAPELPIAFLTAGGTVEILAAAARLGPVFSKTSGIDDAVLWIAAAAGF